MTVEAIDPDAHLAGWPDALEEVPVELPDPAWTRAEGKREKPAKKTTRKQRRRR